MKWFPGHMAKGAVEFVLVLCDVSHKIRPNKKICVSGYTYMLLKIRVGRSDYFFIF